MSAIQFYFMLIQIGLTVTFLVAQLCPTLWDPMHCNPPASSVHGDSPGKSIGMGCHALLQGIFPTQGLNPGLSHCRWILYHLSHQGSPRILEVDSLSLLQGNFLTQESNQGLLHCRRILYQWSYQGSSRFSVPQLLIISLLPEAKPLSHLLLTTRGRAIWWPTYTKPCYSLNMLLRMLADVGWAYLLTLCPQGSGTPTVLAIVCCKLFSP